MSAAHVNRQSKRGGKRTHLPAYGSQAGYAGTRRPIVSHRTLEIGEALAMGLRRSPSHPATRVRVAASLASSRGGGSRRDSPYLLQRPHRRRAASVRGVRSKTEGNPTTSRYGPYQSRNQSRRAIRYLGRGVHGTHKIYVEDKKDVSERWRGVWWLGTLEAL